MRKNKILIALILLIVTSSVKAQLYQKRETSVTNKGLSATQEFYPPVRDTNWTPSKIGAITFRPQDSTAWRFNGTAWIQLTSQLTRAKVILTSGMSAGFIDYVTYDALGAEGYTKILLDGSSGSIDVRGWDLILYDAGIGYLTSADYTYNKSTGLITLSGSRIFIPNEIIWIEFVPKTIK